MYAFLRKNSLVLRFHPITAIGNRRAASIGSAGFLSCRQKRRKRVIGERSLHERERCSTSHRLHHQRHSPVARSQEHLLRVDFPGSVLSPCSHKDTEALEPSHALSATGVLVLLPAWFPCPDQELPVVVAPSCATIGLCRRDQPPTTDLPPFPTQATSAWGRRKEAGQHSASSSREELLQGDAVTASLTR